MPLFEVDANRPLLVQSGRTPAVPGVGTSAHQVVESHIDGLLGEQIFPVAPGSGPDEPHLLALDATGSPVVVELVGELDHDALVRALDHAGSANRLTRGDLAARYHGGPNAFQRDVAAFYDSVPVTRSQPGRSGARLIIICQEAGDAILNAVSFLRQPSMPVEVLKLGVVHSADGRRFVDVSPLAVDPVPDPTPPRLPAPAPAPKDDDPDAPIERRFRRSVPRPDGAGSGTLTEKLVVGIALTGKQPAVVQATDPAPASTGVPVPGVPAPRQQEEPEPPPAPARPQAPLRRSRTDRFAPQPAPAPQAQAGPESAGAGARRSAWEPVAGSTGWDASGDTSADTPLRVPPLDAPSYTPPRERSAFDPLDYDPLTYARASDAVPSSGSTGEPTDRTDATDPADDVDEDLVALAQRLGRPTPLVWSRPRRRQHFEATLHPDGTIELADGGRYRDPGLAASTAAGAPSADGWGVWRLGAGGPTLLEAYRQHFA